MPRLDGLELVAALRADPRTAARARAAAVGARRAGGLHRGLAGRRRRLSRQTVRGGRTARPRARQHRTGAAAQPPRPLAHGPGRLAAGGVLRLRRATARSSRSTPRSPTSSGYGPEGLPYEPAFTRGGRRPTPTPRPTGRSRTRSPSCSTNPTARFTIPVNHRDGHRLWVTVNFNHADDPDTGRRVMVGTFRDVTAEHYTVQRESALAALNQQLAQADTLDDAVRAARRRAAQAVGGARVLAVTLPAGASRTRSAAELVCVGEPTQWADLPSRTETDDHIARATATCSPRTPASPARRASRCSIPAACSCLQIELSEQRPFTAEDHTLLTVLGGRLGQGLQRVHQLDQQRETALALQTRHPRPGEPAHRIRGALPTGHQPASGRR